MADIREALLARLVAVCVGVDGVKSVARNRLDVAALERPAVVVYDGVETLRDQPLGMRFSELSRVELSPAITVIVRAGSTDPGPLLSLYRSRVVVAVLSDATLRSSVGTNGSIRYEGCVVTPPDAEAKEHRLELSLTFTYAFRLDDLVT